MQEVDRLIQEHPVIVFSKSWCPYCTKAKNAFTAEGAEFAVLELDQRADGDELQNALHEKTGVRTVPRVFISGQCVGGGDDVNALQRTGKLSELVQAASSKAE